MLPVRVSISYDPEYIKDMGGSIDSGLNATPMYGKCFIVDVPDEDILLSAVNSYSICENDFHNRTNGFIDLEIETVEDSVKKCDVKGIFLLPEWDDNGYTMAQIDNYTGSVYDLTKKYFNVGPIYIETYP